MARLFGEDHDLPRRYALTMPHSYRHPEPCPNCGGVYRMILHDPSNVKVFLLVCDICDHKWELQKAAMSLMAQPRERPTG